MSFGRRKNYVFHRLKYNEIINENCHSLRTVFKKNLRSKIPIQSVSEEAPAVKVDRPFAQSVHFCASVVTENVPIGHSSHSNPDFLVPTGQTMSSAS